MKALMLGDYIKSFNREVVVLSDNGSGLYDCYDCEAHEIVRLQYIELKHLIRYDADVHNRRKMIIEGNAVRVIPDAPNIPEDLFAQHNTLQFSPLPTRDRIYRYAKRQADSFRAKEEPCSAGELVDYCADDFTQLYQDANYILTNDEEELLYNWFCEQMVDMA